TERDAKVELLNGQLAYTHSGPAKNSEPVYHTLSTPKGRQFSLILPDGSRVWLNVASSIKYPAVFHSTSREVEITGEAYFEIASLHKVGANIRSEGESVHNSNKVPFIVHSGNQSVEVLGTHFNINAYEDEESVKT